MKPKKKAPAPENHPPEFDDGGEHFPTTEAHLAAMRRAFAQLVEVCDRMDARDGIKPGA